MVPVVFFMLLMIFHSPEADSQISDTIEVVREKPEKLLKNLNIHSITQDGFNFWKDKFSGHWAGVDFGFNTLLHPDYGEYGLEFMKNSLLRSGFISLNPVQQSIGLQRNRNTIGLVTGLGLQWLNYRLDKNTTIETSATGMIIPKNLYFDINQKSIFSLFYATLPILAEIQFPVNHYNNRLFISSGIIFQYRISSSTKIRYRLDKKREKLKTPGDYSMPDVRYSLMARTGYRNFQVFCSYDIQPLFKKGTGPELTPFTFGITLLRF
jgi:hypothetical protein